MNHTDHVRLLRPAALTPGGTWADLGAGSGAFTLALRELIGAQAVIYAVDRDRSRLDELKHDHQARFGEMETLRILPADFSRAGNASTSLAQRLPALDGVVMANSLHFFRDKERILRQVRTFLKPGGMLLLVEYNVDNGNMWVPHPLTFESFRTLAPRCGFSEPRLLAQHPSSFLREFYSAQCLAQPGSI